MIILSQKLKFEGKGEKQKSLGELKITEAITSTENNKENSIDIETEQDTKLPAEVMF